MKKHFIAIRNISVLALLLASSPVFAGVSYITPAGAGVKDGSSWGNALSGESLQMSIDELSATGGGEVWVAAGTYYPTLDATGKTAALPQYATFSLRANVHLYGGFAGTETALSQRGHTDKNGNSKIEAWEFANETVLSGDVDRDGKFLSNAYHVVSDMVPDQGNISIDGFTIRDGVALSSSIDISALDFSDKNVRFLSDPKYFDVLGGGVLATNAQISRCIISNNIAALSGGGIAIGGRAAIDSCFIANNICTAFGGGLAIIESGTMRNSTVFYNNGTKAGGVVLHAGGNVYTSHIFNNTSDSVGGIMMNNGGMLIASVVNNNQAKKIGAGGISTSNGTIISCTSANNIDAGNIGVVDSGASIVNSFLYDALKIIPSSKNTLRYNALLQPLASPISAADHNIGINNSEFALPNFNSATSFKGAATANDILRLLEYRTQDWSLYAGNTGINAGSPDISTYTLPAKDIRGTDRVKYGRIDIGAYEFENRLYVSPVGAGDLSGSSWSNAIPFAKLTDWSTLQGEVWLAAGNYELETDIAINHELYLIGGFAGTETSENDRTRSDIDNNGVIDPWEWANKTVFNNKTLIAYKTEYPYYERKYMLTAHENTLVDGITFTSTDGWFRGGALLSKNGTVVNCSVVNNETQFNNYTVNIDKGLMEDCYISGNQSKDMGGGVVVLNKGAVRNCVISRNKSDFYGGGAYIKDGTLSHCTVVQNEIAGEVNVNGGGVNIVSGMIDNCLIANNSAKGFSTRGGGIYVYANDSTVTVRNTTIVHNSVEGVGAEGPDMAVKCAVSMKNSIVGSPLYIQSLNLRNSISYSAIVGGFADLGAGKNIMNIAQADLAAQFAVPSTQMGSFVGAYPYDWQLSPSSVFINKGNEYARGTDSSSYDLAHRPRIIHDTLDLGANEYRIPAPKADLLALKLAEQLTKDSVVFSWNDIDADHYSLWVREGLSGAVRPQPGLVYSAGKKLGSGAILDGWFCVYDGTSTKASVTGLMQGSSYKAMLVPSNGVNYRVYGSQAVEDDNILFFTTKREQSIRLNLPNPVSATSRFVASLTSTSGLNVSLTSPSEQAGTISILGANIAAHRSGSAIITAHQAGNTLFLPATIVDTLVIVKAQQSITFDDMAVKTYGDADFRPTVLATSQKSVALSSTDTDIAEIVNDAIRIKKPGTVQIVADQLGDDIYERAPSVTRTLSIAKAPQYILFGEISDKIYGNEDFSPFVKASSGLDVLLTPDNNSVVEIINKATIHIIGAGTVMLTAIQAGNEYYEPAKLISQVLTVMPADQKIVFRPIADKVFGSGDFFADAQSTSALPVTLTSSNTAVATTDGNKIRITGKGTVEITASQNGDKLYKPAISVVQRFTVNQDIQTISVSKYIQKTYGDADFLLDGKSSSQLPITYSSESSIIEIIGETVHIKACGSATIVASQSGNDNISSASETIVLNISKQTQEITFPPLAQREYADVSFKPMVSSTANLPVVLTSSDNAVARIINSNEIQIVGAGVASITATQSGNDTVLSALPQIQALTVLKINQEIQVKKPITTLVYGSKDTVLVVTSTADLPVFIQSSNKSIIDIDGSILRIKGVGKVAIRMYQSGTAGIAPAERIDTVEVLRAQQSIIDLDMTILAKMGEEPVILNASSSAGFEVKYRSLNPRVADMVGNRVKFLAPGRCKIVAYTLQSTNYEAASDTCAVIVSALDVFEMPSFATSRDTIIDLNALRLNRDSIVYSFVSATHNSVVVDGSKAIIKPKHRSDCWEGTDTLWFNAANQAVVGDSLTFAVKLAYTRHADQIGMVTTDSLTGTYNIIAWEPQYGANTAQWIVCRRSQSLSQWENIDTVPVTDSTYSVDRKVNTRQQAYQYALKTVDSSGCESQPSARHTTMHLKSGVSLQGLPQLWWSAYEGVEVDSYIIYRKNQQTQQFDSIGSTFLTSFTDQYPNGSASYRVAIRFAHRIVTSRLKSDSGPFSQSMSNLSEAIILTTDLADGAGIALSPNPVADMTTLSLPSSQCIVTVTDANGRQVLPAIEASGEAVIDASSLSQGVYNVTVIAGDEMYLLHMVKTDGAK